MAITTEELKQRLEIIKQMADFGIKYNKVFRDYITQNLNGHFRFVDEDANPHCIDILTYGLHLRVRIEITWIERSIESVLRACIVSCDGKKEEVICSLPFDNSNIYIYLDENQTPPANRLEAVPSQLFPRIIFDKILGNSVTTTFKPH